MTDEQIEQLAQRVAKLILNHLHEGLILDMQPDEEEDLLDKAWGLEPDSRLSCQTIPEEGEFTVELPKYTINQVSEDH